jgi:hypothetical protein
MADGSDGNQRDNDDRIRALFSGVNQTSHELAKKIAHPGAAHPSRMRAQRAGMPIGRLIRDDLEHSRDLRENGLPGEIAPPRPTSPQSPAEGLVQQHRQMTGLAPNSRSNTFLFDPKQFLDPNTPNTSLPFTVPFLQFNGTTDETDMLTVMLAQQFAAPLPGNITGDSFLWKALLKWGVGTAFFQTTIDWKQGTAISLTANYLDLSCVIPATRTDRTPVMTFAAGVAYGAVPAKNSRATFSTSTGTIAHAGGSATVVVPPWAVSFGIAPSAATFAGPFTVASSGGGGPGFIITPRATGLDLNCDAFTLPNGTALLSVTNNDPAVDSNFAVVFGFPF